MINHNNWETVQEYLKYKSDIQGRDPKTVRAYKMQLAHLLEWCDSTPFEQAPKKEPTFSAYLETKRRDGIDKPILPKTAKAILDAAGLFFKWCRLRNPTRYKAITPIWLETLNPTRKHKAQTVIHEREFYTLDEVQKLLAVPTDTMARFRDQAAAAFLFLSGIRIGAFVTLPIKAIDLDKLVVYQYTSYGVETKFQKNAITTLLDIPELMEVVRKWDNAVRGSLSPDNLWYSKLNAGGEFVPYNAKDCKRSAKIGSSVFFYGLSKLCALADIPVKSAHKFRHGHAVYIIKHASSIAQLKALSQNLMHANLGITDGVYGVLSETDSHELITGIGKDAPSNGAPNNLIMPAQPQSTAELVKFVLHVLRELQKEPGLLETILAELDR